MTPVQPLTPRPDMQEVQSATPRDTATQDVQSAPVTPIVPTTPPLQSAVPVGQPPVAPPAAIGQGWNWFLRIVGIVLALAAGMVFELAFDAWFTSLQGPATQDWWWVALAAVGFVAWTALAAVFFRSWWAVLIVPLAYYIGVTLVPLFQSGFDFQQWLQYFSLGGRFAGPVMLVAILPPAVVGAFIGSPLGKWVERRMRR